MPPDAHTKPTEELKTLFKKYQRASASTLDADIEVLDFERGINVAQSLFLVEEPFISGDKVNAAFARFLSNVQPENLPAQEWTCYSVTTLPGLTIIPALIPPLIQKEMLSRLLHRDLSNPVHQTNVHFHHCITYPAHNSSFFDLAPSSSSHFTPKPPSTSPLTIAQFLTRKLRWLTLGGQYDWTLKRYPHSVPPPFPPDLHALIHALFPATDPQAAILNLYSPGDVLSLHRDVSEECEAGLVSVSFGCDGLFVVALGAERVVLRLRSGDAVYMDGRARYAWHGVPVVLGGTCPVSLKDWPVEDGEERFEAWRGWLSGKRLNLNVRQMRE